MGELADALDHLHTRAILGAHVAHRDVKPPTASTSAKITRRGASPILAVDGSRGRFFFSLSSTRTTG